MTPEELIAWHAHQIALLPETDNVMVQHHREAMHCVERLRAELAQKDKTESLLREQVRLLRAELAAVDDLAMLTEAVSPMSPTRSARQVIQEIISYHQQADRAELASCQKDAERLAWWFDFDSHKPSSFMTTYLQGMQERWNLDQWRAAIDAARKVGA